MIEFFTHSCKKRQGLPEERHENMVLNTRLKRQRLGHSRLPLQTLLFLTEQQRLVNITINELHFCLRLRTHL